MLKSFLLAAALLSVSGCASLGIAAPQTFDEKVYATQLAVDKVVTQADALLKAKVIAPKDASNIADLASAAKDGIAIARSVAVTSGADAGDARLQIAIAALSKAQAYLLKQQGTK